MRSSHTSVWHGAQRASGERLELLFLSGHCTDLQTLVLRSQEYFALMQRVEQFGDIVAAYMEEI